MWPGENIDKPMQKFDEVFQNFFIWLIQNNEPHYN